ncbi:MAG: PQQ-binding-like beta-propeller repeat protein, partial [Vicinamibacterales bacterium]
MRPFLGFAFMTFVAAAVIRLSAEDWPQFLGPERNGVYRGPALAEMWGPQGPRVVWRKTVGQGFSGPVVAQGRVIIFHRVGNEEVVEALDARTGASQWRYAYATAYRDDFGFDEGPRAVPVVASGAVYTFGAQGQLHAIDLA